MAKKGSLKRAPNTKLNKRKFLDAYAALGKISPAARAANIVTMTVYDWKNTDPQFALDMEQAMLEYKEKLETEADRRAVDGIADYVVSGGSVVEYKKRPLVKRRYSDNLLMFRLKRLDPGYRDRVDINQTGNVTVNVRKYSAEGKEIELNDSAG